MQRFGLPFTILVMLLIGLAGLRSAPGTDAQESTPATGAGRCPSPLATPATESVCVGVIFDDFVVRPQGTTFRVGETYVFSVGNEGAAVHEFVIEPAGKVDEPLEAKANGKVRESEIEDIAPGETDELEWTFTEPGRYQFACHVPGHFEAGMVIEVEVEA